MQAKAIVFDVDGVLSTHGQSFSVSYAEQRGIDYSLFRTFFQGDFQQALVGKADLKQLMHEHTELWGDENIDKVIAAWFAAEAHLNSDLLKAVSSIRSQGTPCYLATNQEQYRGKYIQDVMFPNQFDGCFISGLVGAKKPEEEFFAHVIATIQDDIPGIIAQEILFIDDSPEHIEGATKLGITAHLHKDQAETLDLLSRNI